MVLRRRLRHVRSIGLPDARSKAVLSFHQLVENSDESFLLDNEALFLCGSGALDSIFLLPEGF